MQPLRMPAGRAHETLFTTARGSKFAASGSVQPPRAPAGGSAQRAGSQNETFTVCGLGACTLSDPTTAHAVMLAAPE